MLDDVQDSLAELDAIEQAVLVLVLLIGGYYLYQAVKGIWTKAGGSATVTGLAPGLKSGAALTSALARGITAEMGVAPDQYQLSPDNTQIWFSNGSYYDNTTGNLYLSDQTNLGPLYDANHALNSGTVNAAGLGYGGTTADVVGLL